MSATDTRNPHGWPDRSALIAWGMALCRAKDCRVLVNPAQAPNGRCQRCEEARRRRRLEAAAGVPSVRPNRKRGKR